MNLVVDQGNTRIKFSIFDNSLLINTFTFQNSENVTIDKIKNLYPNLEFGIISNVSANETLLETISNMCKKTLILTTETPLPIKIEYSTPET